jgi:hypothetical protein
MELDSLIASFLGLYNGLVLPKTSRALSAD